MNSDDSVHPGGGPLAMLRGCVVVVLVGCRPPAAAPSASNPAVEPSPAPSRQPVPATAATEPAPAPSLRMGLPQTRAAFEEAGAWVVSVPALPGPGSHCHSIEVQPGTTRGRGFVRPAKVENTTEDDQAAPYRRLEFEFEASDAGLVLRSPRATLRRDTALLSGCTVTVPWDALSMYDSVAECEDDEAQPLSWGDCEAPLTGFAADVRTSQPPAKGPLDHVLSSGGQVYALERGPEDAQCLPWVFTPGRKKSAHGRMVRTVTEGSRRTQTEYSYDYNGATLLLLGPSTTVTEDGREVSSMSFGCGERLYLRSPSPAYATAAGTPWFFSLEACRDATIPPPLRGGC